MIGYMFATESTKCMGELPFCLKFFIYNPPLLRLSGYIKILRPQHKLQLLLCKHLE